MTSYLTSATLITIIHVHIASNGLRGYGGCGIQTTSEVTSDLKIQLSDLDYLCYHASLASKSLQ